MLALQQSEMNNWPKLLSVVFITQQTLMVRQSLHQIGILTFTKYDLIAFHKTSTDVAVLVVLREDAVPVRVVVLRFAHVSHLRRLKVVGGRHVRPLEVRLGLQIRVLILALLTLNAIVHIFALIIHSVKQVKAVPHIKCDQIW